MYMTMWLRVSPWLMVSICEIYNITAFQTCLLTTQINYLMIIINMYVYCEIIAISSLYPKEYIMHNLFYILISRNSFTYVHSSVVLMCE